MRTYLVLGLFLFCWVNLSKQISDEMRLFSVATFAPSWKWAKGIRSYLADRPERFWSREGHREGADPSELKRLQLENRTLRASLDKMSQWLVAEERIASQLETLKGITCEMTRAEEGHWREFFRRRSSHLRNLLQWELMALPAQAIYRDPASWSSSIWVNVGEENNRVLGSVVIAKNSPVVSGIALVGVVDYVGKRQSRVRLMTDSGLSPSVRAVRGESQENYLAKGELHGSSAPFWRSRSPLLKGIGFNFDYPDEEGAPQKGVPILKEGDLLFTSGLDGVFPPDLLVGTVLKVIPPKVGGYAYELEARPAATSMNDLDTLFILPPRSD